MKQKSLLILFIILFSWVLLFSGEEEVLPFPISGFEDAGVYKLIVQDTEIGKIDFILTLDGHYKRNFTISMAGQTAEFFMEVESNAAGEWESIRITAPTDSVTVERLGDKAEYHLEKKDETYSVELKNDHILYDNYGPVFEGIMLKAYDMEKKGIQTFSRYIVPSMSAEAKLEFKGQEIRRVNDKDWNLNRFDLSMVGVDVQIWADKQHKILLMNVPSQHAAYVREGFDDLLQVSGEDPLLSKPQYQVEKKTVMIPMRDGIKLSTDLYFPQVDGAAAAKAASSAAESKASSAASKFPVILIRTPYMKEMNELPGNYFGKRGYVVAVQDCRGRFASEGTWEPFINEPEDGYDTIEWLGTREWSSGKVGMIGGSYVGWVQLWAASENPPHLTTIIPNVAPPDPFYNIPYEYGSFFILGAIWWAEILEKEATGDLSGQAMAQINERKYEKILKSLPVVELDEKILGKKNPYWRKWIEHNTNDQYWQQANFLEKLKTLDIPVFLQSGWFDGDGIGSKLNYMALKQSKNKYIKLILGPWGHSDQSYSQVGDFNFGKEAAPDLQTMYLRWFD